jgi:hypothetical protein
MIVLENYKCIYYIYLFQQKTNNFEGWLDGLKNAPSQEDRGRTRGGPEKMRNYLYTLEIL